MKLRGRRGATSSALAVGLVTCLFAAASADAASPEFLLRVPAEIIMPGPGAGQLDNPRGIGASSTSGDLYVSDRANARIDEFSPWGIFIRAWGWDVAPNGSAGDTVSDEFEICTTTCKAGVKGLGFGQIKDPEGIVVDASGDVYVDEVEESHRVQKFDSEGNFLLMFGGEGTGNGQFSDTSLGNYITYNPKTNTIFAGDKDRIQEFDLNGNFKAKIDFEGALAGENVDALVSDPKSGDLYLVLSGSAHVYRLEIETGNTFPVAVAELPTIEAEVEGEEVPQGPVALAVDAVGNLYVDDDPPGTTAYEHPRTLEFDLVGEKLIPSKAEEEACEAAKKDEELCQRFGEPADGNIQKVTQNGLATNVLGPGSEEAGDLYADYFTTGAESYFKAYGPSPIEFEDPPKVPPEIKAQYAVSVDLEGAALKAQINPRFWPKATYYVQYGTGECSKGGCEEEQPVPPGAILTAKSTNARVTTAGVLLDGLQPGTIYHYRFVAESEGGGPVFGVDGKSGEDGEEDTFRTFRVEGVSEPCPNDALRTGPAAKLADCRAYELVSPLKKNNGDIVTPSTGGSASGSLNTVDQSSSAGEMLTYSAATSFGEPQSAPFVSQYLAERHPPGDPQEGWSSAALSPPRTRPIFSNGSLLDNEFEAFSADLCSAWLQTVFDPPLAEGGVKRFRNLYRRENCGGGGYEALGPGGEPSNQVPVDYKQRLQGASADGSHTIFAADDNLPGTEAPENKNTRFQLYENSKDGGLSFVCILPNGNATKEGCSAGTADENLGSGFYEHWGSYQNAISASGERVFWTEAPAEAKGVGPGKIYVRFEDEPKSRPVSQSVSSAKARFWGAAADGSKVLFAIEEAGSPVNENLYSFDVEEEEATLIAKGVKGVLGLSNDASHVYFASIKAIAGAGENSEGDEAVAGETNIYLYRQGEGGEEPTYSFVGTLAVADIVDQIFTPFNKKPLYRTSRVSPDGRHVAFLSSARLTGYDNTDAASGEADQEVFVYDAGEGTSQGQLRCVSCNASGARPSGIDLQTINSLEGLAHQWAAARIPGWERPLYASRALSDDGRLFFESFEALLPADTNGVGDVYEWEAQGSGTCDADDAGFSADSGGCLNLISSGESPRASVFIDADPTGKNVFFATLSSLVAPDPGLVDIYDARVDGGFAYPQAKTPCEGEACQSPSAPPDDPTPSSASVEGAGNVKHERKPRKRCSKSQRRVVHRGKAPCVKKPAKQSKQAQHRHGGTAR